ncbi:uncharacterized, partial [Tachysurus ichikawai]
NISLAVGFIRIQEVVCKCYSDGEIFRRRKVTLTFSWNVTAHRRLLNVSQLPVCLNREHVS